MSNIKNTVIMVNIEVCRSSGCRNIEDILLEKVAVVEAENKIGLHGGDPAHPHRMVDISRSVHRNTFADRKLGNRIEPDVLTRIILVGKNGTCLISCRNKLFNRRTTDVVVSKNDTLHNCTPVIFLQKLPYNLKIT